MRDSRPLTPEQAARALGISRTTVYELIAKGELAAFRIDRAIRIEPQAIEQFKASRRVKAQTRVDSSPVKRTPALAPSSVGTDRYVN